jgi:hypothetical protein
MHNVFIMRVVVSAVIILCLDTLSFSAMAQTTSIRQTEEARYPRFHSPVMDCINRGGGRECAGADSRSAFDIYADMMASMGFSRREAKKLYGGSSKTISRCKPIGHGNFECKIEN